MKNDNLSILILKQSFIQKTLPDICYVWSDLINVDREQWKSSQEITKLDIYSFEAKPTYRSIIEGTNSDLWSL
jgi:hypothetical protein